MAEKPYTTYFIQEAQGALHLAGNGNDVCWWQLQEKAHLDLLIVLKGSIGKESILTDMPIDLA